MADPVSRDRTQRSTTTKEARNARSGSHRSTLHKNRASRPGCHRHGGAGGSGRHRHPVGNDALGDRAAGTDHSAEPAVHLWIRRPLRHGTKSPQGLLNIAGEGGAEVHTSASSLFNRAAPRERPSPHLPQPEPHPRRPPPQPRLRALRRRAAQHGRVSL